MDILLGSNHFSSAGFNQLLEGIVLLAEVKCGRLKAPAPEAEYLHPIYENLFTLSSQLRAS
jgi:hypothetical protein